MSDILEIRIQRLADEVALELTRACRKFGPMASPHEGWAVIYEEFVKELGAHVWDDTGRGPEARAEAIQTAAMALRYVLDLCDTSPVVSGEETPNA